MEKPERCEEEKEACSPKPEEEDNRPENDADDVTAEYDELHEPPCPGVPRELEEPQLKDADVSRSRLIFLLAFIQGPV